MSEQTGRAFLGYVDTQRKRLLDDSRAPRTRELSAQHGYDSKYAMHSLRIAHQGIELLTRGRISLPVPADARQRLMAIRRGEVPLPEVLGELETMTTELERAAAAPAIREQPDRSAIDAFLVRAYECSWSAS